MKLYLHPASPNCMAAVMTAAALGLPLETEFVDITAGAQHQPGYLALNPNGLVPTLRDGDFVLWETNAITQYLAAAKPGNTLWPEDRRRRADIARWQFWALAHWFPAVQPYMWENLFKRLRGLGDPDPAALAGAAAKLKKYAGVLDDHLGDRAWLAGDGLTLADISVASYLMYARPARIPLEDYPAIRRWFGAVEMLPAWQKAQPTGLPPFQQGQTAARA